MPEHILVTLDGSPLAEQALVYAVPIARDSGAHLHLATVTQRPPLALPELPVPASLGEIEADYLEDVAGRARENGVSTVSFQALPGDDVVAALEAHREQVKADLTVMCSHGHGPVRRAWMGSVADRFLCTTAAPVLLVRAEAGAATGPDLGADKGFEHVLILVDGSALSELAVEPAVELGRHAGAAFTLARLVEPPHGMGALWLPKAVELTEERLAEARNVAEAELGALSERLRAEGIETKSVLRFVEHVADAIIQIAEELETDLIAMTSHGRAGVQRLALGSVADKVTRTAECPVLVVPPKNRRQP